MEKKKSQGRRKDWDPHWAEAKRRCGLNADTVAMAKELGLNPRSLIKNIPSPSEPWKAPVRIWIQEMYRKRKGKPARVARENPKPKRDWMPPAPPAGRETPGAGSFPAPDREPVGEDEEATWREILEEEEEAEEVVDPARVDQDLLRRQREFRLAAEYIARDLSRVPEVEKIVLFGSVAAPLEKEVPRFREYRRRGIPVFHECKDVDLAVWMRSFERLKDLQRARAQALNRLFKEKGIGVAHHQVEIFLFEPESGRHVGRLCHFGTCPKEGKPECLVPGCGASPFLRLFPDFIFEPNALDPSKSVVLYVRSGRSVECAPAPPAAGSPGAEDGGQAGDNNGDEEEIPF